MNFEAMSLSELKEYAKEIGVTVGNCGKEKLIEKIKEKEIANSVMNDDDYTVEKVEDTVSPVPTATSLIESISQAIDELDDSAKEDVQIGDVGLSLDDVIPVKSITFGGLTYRARSTNAIFRWNQIGAIEYMTVAELNEMNNYKSGYLNKPLVILLDERAIKKFRLQHVYENVAKINNLKELFTKDPEEIKSTIKFALSVSMRDILISKTRQMIKSGTLTNINVIHLLEKELQFDFSEAI